MGCIYIYPGMMGLGKIFLTGVGSGQFFVAQVGSAIFGLDLA